MPTLTKFKFLKFLDYEDGKIACLETTDNLHIPVNIYIDNYEDVKDFEIHTCEIDVYGHGSSIEIFKSEDDFLKADLQMAPEFMIPTGTFPFFSKGEDFVQDPNIIFCGTVISAHMDKEAREDETNYYLWIKTLEMEMDLYVRYDGVIEQGDIVYGMAYLSGDMERPLS